METRNSALGPFQAMVIGAIVMEIVTSATSISRIVRESFAEVLPGTGWAEREEYRAFGRRSVMLRGSTTAQLHRLL